MEYIVGIGSNVGFKIINIQLAIKFLSLNKSVNIISKASLYSSKAILKKNDPKIWNIDFFEYSGQNKICIKTSRTFNSTKRNRALYWQRS